MLKRFLAAAMAWVMLLTMMPIHVNAEEPGSTGNVLSEEAGDDTVVTRVQWLKALTETFAMAVEEDNYPDNYYSDIDTSYEYYYEIMLATEFGLIDVEAGEAMRPDDPATREFAAHTLNLCLGYCLDEEAEYTFSEKAEVTYPEDIQIAVNKGWFSLEQGQFLPENGITVSEKDAMLAFACEELDKTVIDTEHENTYEFAEGVVVLPEDTEIELAGENQYVITNSSVALAEGDIFGIVKDNFPLARKATKVTTAGNQMVVQTESVSMEDAFHAIDIQGELDVDLTQIQALDDTVEISYIVGGTQDLGWEDGTFYSAPELVGDQEISAVSVQKSYDIPSKVRAQYDIANGVKATINCKISNVRPDYKINGSDVYFKVNATTAFSTNVSLDVLEAVGAAPSYEIARVNIGLVGYMTATLEMALEGSITLSLVENISAGIYFSHGNFRLVYDFKKQSFTIQAQAVVSTGVKLAAGFDVGALKGSIYGRVGAKGTFNMQTYDDGATPTRCSHFSAYMYAGVGADVSVDLVLYKKSWGEYITIYNASNSPVRVVYHYEDGVPVACCSRSGQYYGYYTPADSRYGYNGASSGVGSDGEPFTIFEYSLSEEGNATITSYRGNVSALSIPSTLDGYPVVAIGSHAFNAKTELRIVIIPDGITEIGEGAFAKCTNLASVDLPSTLIKMGAHAFYNCDQLTGIEIPKSLESTYDAYIYEYAYGYVYGPFYGCDGLKEITFEEGTTLIANDLFANCPGVESVMIPDTVTKIGNGAFHNCSNLKHVTIPDAVTEIGWGSFRNCGLLEKVALPDAITKIDIAAFAECKSLTVVNLPKSLTTIGAHAFYDCDLLTSIVVPKSLESTYDAYINEYAYGYVYGPFYGCDGLKNITFEEGTTKVANDLFANCPGIEAVVLPDTITTISSGAFNNCSNLKEVTFSDFITEIGWGAFRRCVSLEKAELPDTITKIDSAVFAECSGLTTLHLPKALKEMGAHAFYNCDALTSVEIPKTLTNTYDAYIYEYAYGYVLGPFYQCDGLKEATFEEGSTVIAQGLFACCYGLEKVTIPDSITTINYKAFDSCKNLKEVQIPDSVTYIGTDVFRNCTSLTKASLPKESSKIPNYLFYGCSALAEITLPETVTSIGKCAFENAGLTKVSIPEAVTYVDEYAFKNTAVTCVEFNNSPAKLYRSVFENCAYLEEVDLGENITYIGNYGFRNCDALTEIVIPDSVTELGTYIFADSELLKDVTLGNGLTGIPAYAFNLCPSLESMVIPYRVKTINNNAFSNCTKLTEVTIPRATDTIGSEAFSYPTKMTIYGVAGTYAETYANEIGATFVNKEVNATEVSLNKTTLSLNKGATETLVFTVIPDNFTDEVSWVSSDESIVTISDTGLVTAKAVGTATIKVYVGDASATCKVTVLQPVTYVGLNETYLELEALETYTLTASVSPDSAYNKNIVWSTADESIATVDENGFVTAVSAGKTTITAKAADGSGKYRNCTVVVTGIAHICTEVSELESTHKYANNTTEMWLYTLEGAGKLAITFDEQTNLEEDFDFLYVYDGTGEEVGKYTGTELAGATIYVSGDSVKLKLVTNSGGTEWGFKVTELIEFVGGEAGFGYDDSGNLVYYDEYGNVDTTKNGLVLNETTGQYLYVENGAWNTELFGFAEFGGGQFLVLNGTIATDISGVQLVNDQFYFLANGQLQNQYTGLALYDGQWFYVVNGVLQINYNGLQTHDGALFLIAAGRIVNDYVGLYSDSESGNWYYIVNGQVQSYTGLVAYDGAWFYLVDGILANGYTGNVVWNGATFYVVNGQVA